MFFVHVVLWVRVEVVLVDSHVWLAGVSVRPDEDSKQTTLSSDDETALQTLLVGLLRSSCILSILVFSISLLDWLSTS